MLSVSEPGNQIVFTYINKGKTKKYCLSNKMCKLNFQWNCKNYFSYLNNSITMCHSQKCIYIRCLYNFRYGWYWNILRYIYIVYKYSFQSLKNGCSKSDFIEIYYRLNFCIPYSYVIALIGKFHFTSCCLKSRNGFCSTLVNKTT